MPGVRFHPQSRKDLWSVVLPGLGEASLGPDPWIRRTPRLTQRCKKISPRSRSVRARPADPRSPDSFPSFCVSSQHGAGLPRLASRFYPGCRLLCGSPRLAKPLLPAAKVGRCRPLPVGRTAWRAGCGGSPPSNHFSLGAPGPYLPGAPVPRSHLRPTPVCGRLTCAEPIIPDPPAPPQQRETPLPQICGLLPHKARLLTVSFSVSLPSRHHLADGRGRALHSAQTAAATPGRSGQRAFDLSRRPRPAARRPFPPVRAPRPPVRRACALGRPAPRLWAAAGCRERRKGSRSRRGPRADVGADGDLRCKRAGMRPGHDDSFLPKVTFPRSRRGAALSPLLSASRSLRREKRPVPVRDLPNWLVNPQAASPAEGAAPSAPGQPPAPGLRKNTAGPVKFEFKIKKIIFFRHTYIPCNIWDIRIVRKLFVHLKFKTGFYLAACPKHDPGRT